MTFDVWVGGGGLEVERRDRGDVIARDIGRLGIECNLRCSVYNHFINFLVSHVVKVDVGSTNPRS